MQTGGGMQRGHPQANDRARRSGEQRAHVQCMFTLQTAEHEPCGPVPGLDVRAARIGQRNEALDHHVTPQRQRSS
jgi:hypothetical protein